MELDNTPIKTIIYPLRKGRYLISINDKTNLFELSFFNGNRKKAHERAIFLLKQVIKNTCKISDEEIEKYFQENENERM